LALPALVFGSVATSKTSGDEKLRGGGLAVTGIIMAGISILGWAAVVIAYLLREVLD
jgi:predicted permease